MDKVTERIFNIAENKKEMSEELPKPSLNLPWECHTSTAWLHSSKRKLTYSRTLQCDGSPIRTRSRKVRQLQYPQLPRNSEPQVCLPPLLPQCPFAHAHGGKAMDVDTHSGTSQPSGAPFPYPFTHTPVAPLPPPRNLSHPQWLLHLLDQNTNKKISHRAYTEGSPAWRPLNPTLFLRWNPHCPLQPSRRVASGQDWPDP